MTENNNGFNFGQENNTPAQPQGEFTYEQQVQNQQNAAHGQAQSQYQYSQQNQGQPQNQYQYGQPQGQPQNQFQYDQQNQYGGQQYGQNQYGSYGPAEVPGHSKAVQALILAIVGLCCCGPCGIVGLVFSNQAAEMGNTEGINKAAKIVSIIAIVLWGLGIIGTAASGLFSQY